MADIREISESLRYCGVVSLKLSGGEPTVRQDLPEIIDVVGESLKPVVITNGIRLRDAVVEAALRAKGEFKFSIHRPSSENDNVLGVSSFANVLRNLQRCRSLGVPFSINSVVDSATCTYIRELTEFAVSSGARKISFVPVVPRGRAGRVKANGDLEADELEAIRGMIHDLSARYRERIVVRCIDIRRQAYWIVENDGTLWIEKTKEEQDVQVLTLNEIKNLRRGGNDSGKETLRGTLSA